MHHVLNYPDEMSYQNAWLALLDVEAAYAAVALGNSITIQNVFLQWKQENLGAALIYTATFDLPIQFLNERFIKTPYDMSFSELFKPANVRYLESFFGDFICVRCHNLQLSTSTEVHPDVAVIANNNDPVTWVAHCVVLNAREVKDKTSGQGQATSEQCPPPLHRFYIPAAANFPAP